MDKGLNSVSATERNPHLELAIIVIPKQDVEKWTAQLLPGVDGWGEKGEREEWEGRRGSSKGEG